MTLLLIVQVEKGTIKPHANFKVNEDVETLCKAIQGFGM